MADRETLYFDDAAAWERWLDENHALSDAIDLAIAKKGAGVPSVTAAEALEVALCFGWINGVRNRLDERHYLQSYMPRRARSTWSQVNRDIVEELIAAGRMRPAGQTEIDRAKADGRWDAAYAPASRIEVPPELQSLLDANPAAAAFFATLSGQNRYAILFRIVTAKRPETRARRATTFVEMLERGETIYPQ
ncbi:Uncharacterized conserved protein YdeI, YjbR/CyaY-like superfamily, DUF1801 family [Paramicrobacterium humi]|uniref:Uncharacterized conserved protein YdeI, YjbR/CyaY-like superfamily, DUF1801 family n=1 Tax=Paramicrobacterium humi TaxID=640635 RepID=A0A1H4L694_9MICO|nr:YdeI/OmpD-associated family protein [Microbacterium humi]SEB65692.1 Uncharacterized conserved protein YdeI, YjbR/CyaY-like superfamily, DUF1801 family [Microbacterium humi]